MALRHELLGTLKAGDAVLTPKLDRMFRSALDALDVLAAATEARRLSTHDRSRRRRHHDGISKLVFTILSAVAEPSATGSGSEYGTSRPIRRSAGGTWAAPFPSDGL